MSTGPHIFGVRHLSPAAAWHLGQLLDRVRPKLVLIEGSDDADELIPHIVSPKSKRPIAILSYTATAPAPTFSYPPATHRPEYQALVRRQENNVKVTLRALPSSFFLGLYDRDDGTAVLDSEKPQDKQETDQDDDDSDDDDAVIPPAEAKAERESVYQQIARLAGEPDYETYWERHFEQLHAENSYVST